eukprot:4355446-Pyramimonas_sp.AAC.1
MRTCKTLEALEETIGKKPIRNTSTAIFLYPFIQCKKPTDPTDIGSVVSCSQDAVNPVATDRCLPGSSGASEANDREIVCVMPAFLAALSS